MGADKFKFDEEKLKGLMRFKPSLEDTAAFFDCHERTVERHIKEVYGHDFKTFRDRYMVHTRMKLVQKAIEKAERGDNIMLIFTLKNLCGWKDKWDNDNGQGEKAPPPVQLTKEQYEDYVKKTVEFRRLKAVPK